MDERQRPYCVSIKVVNSAGLIWVANPSSRPADCRWREVLKSAVALLFGEPALMAIGLNSGEVFLVSAEYEAAAGPESGARNPPRRLRILLVVCRC